MADSTEATVVPKKIGGSLAVFLPADVVRRGDIREGVPVRIAIHRPARMRVLGVLKRRGAHRPFNRHEEGFWPDA